MSLRHREGEFDYRNGIFNYRTMPYRKITHARCFLKKDNAIDTAKYGLEIDAALMEVAQTVDVEIH